MTVNCCHLNNTIELAACGDGVSCAGSCSALGASLCPSGNCTGDCEIPFGQEDGEIQTRKESSAPTKAVLSDGAHPNAKFGVIMGVVTIQHVTKRGAEPVAGLITLLVFAHVSTP